MFVLIVLPDDLPPRSESSQYFVSFATMLLRHNRLLLRLVRRARFAEGAIHLLRFLLGRSPAPIIAGGIC